MVCFIRLRSGAGKVPRAPEGMHRPITYFVLTFMQLTVSGCALLPGYGQGTAALVVDTEGFPVWLASTGVAIVKLNGVPVPLVRSGQVLRLATGHYKATVRHYTPFGAFKFASCTFHIRRAGNYKLVLHYEQGIVRASLLPSEPPEPTREPRVKAQAFTVEN